MNIGQIISEAITEYDPRVWKFGTSYQIRFDDHITARTGLINIFANGSISFVKYDERWEEVSRCSIYEPDSIDKIQEFAKCLMK